MANKYYGINDKWTDDDLTNVIEVASEDGTVSSVKVNGVEYGGGGGGSMTLILEDSYTVAADDTSTSNTKVKTTSIDDYDYENNPYILVEIRREGGDAVDGAYYGCDQIGLIMPYGSQSRIVIMLYRYASGALVTGGYGDANSGAYGIYVNGAITSSGKLNLDVYKRYSATITPNWAGSYDIKVYAGKLEPELQAPERTLSI